MLGAAIHIAGHCVHAYLIRQSPIIQPDPLELWKLSAEEKMSGMTFLQQVFNLQIRCAGFTGIILTVMMLAILLTALNCSRRRTNCFSRRIGGFNLMLGTMDRLLLANNQSIYLSLRSVKLLPRDVIGLTFELPQGFAYQAGQYILLDWCSALRKRLTQEAPAQAAGVDPSESKAPKAPLLIEYRKCTVANSPVIYNMPKVAAAAGAAKGDTEAALDESQGPRLLGRNVSGKQMEPMQSGETMISRVQPGMLPPEAVVLQVTGPFGAPAQKVWGFDTLMVVGAGIGVTPFASILKSVQLRAKQRETIMSTATRPSAWRNAIGGEQEDARAGLQRLVEELVVVPKKIYFYWICRGQEEFDWFCDLLSDAAEGPAAGIVDITLFITGEIELAQVKKLPCASGQFFGRPNWGRIFKQHLGRWYDHFRTEL
eukprot:g25463.t1